jgi:hypothetical protein
MTEVPSALRLPAAADGQREDLEVARRCGCTTAAGDARWLGRDGPHLGREGRRWARSRRRGGAGVAGSEGRASPARRSEGHRCEVVLAGCGGWISPPKVPEGSRLMAHEGGGARLKGAWSAARCTPRPAARRRSCGGRVEMDGPQSGAGGEARCVARSLCAADLRGIDGVLRGQAAACGIAGHA